MLRRLILAAFLFIFLSSTVFAQTKNSLVVAEQDAPVAFPLFTNNSTPAFYYDSKDAKVVQIAAEAFAGDINLVSGKTIKLNTSGNIADDYAIIAGTIGHAALIDELVKAKQLDVSKIKDQWERFTITVINQPYKKAKKLLVIAGSDRRGTAYGIFHLSRAMGVSPLVWWADVLPAKKQQLFVSGNYTSAAPSVQYRGIFINDEDWGMQPWAAKKMDTDIKDIGPKTYAKVFELLLRLKANYIWPAMHPCTKAFYYYKQNPKVADDYAIVVGGSHCEPMLRNNVCEWAETYEEEYKKKPGEWRYDVNRDEIYKYWDDRIKEAVNYESVFTVGMRGVHDGSMPGPKDPNEKVKLLEKVITDQREILQNNFKKAPEALPQIFVPYKEVLSLYRRGLKLPDDITIIWPDDNYGYIRQLPDDTEQKRSGGNGVYYHLSYWGSPADYLWLSTTSPALIGYEMKKAYDYNAKKLWVFNVGDIKPAELEMQFAMDMAWDINTYDPASASAYIKQWATAAFGTQAMDDIAAIKQSYYSLAAAGKPEHLNMLKFTAKEINERLEAYQKLEDMMNSCAAKIPATLTDAFYQLIKYPAQGAALLNRKILYQQLAQLSLQQNQAAEAKEYLQMAQQHFNIIQEITERYNRFTALGKWNGMMDWKPRNQKVFNAPPVLDSLKPANDSVWTKKQYREGQRVAIVTAQQLYNSKSVAGCTLLNGVGVSGAGLSPSAAKASIAYKTKLNAGTYTIVVKCLPTFAMEKERLLQYSVSFNTGAAQTVNVNAEAETNTWKENVLQGFSAGETTLPLTTSGITAINIELLNKNIVLSQIEIYKVD
ncbi:glycosyl hydrolase 115 family protein [Ferruginibacter sp.]